MVDFLIITLRDGLVFGSIGNDGEGEGAGGDVDDNSMSQRPSPVVLRLPWKIKVLFLETFSEEDGAAVITQLTYGDEVIVEVWK